MTVDEIAATFEEVSDEEYLKFERIPVNERRHGRSDICAFLLLDELFPAEHGSSRDMVCGASHDEIWLDPNLDPDGDHPITREHIVYLSRCGVRWDTQHGCGFCMFV